MRLVLASFGTRGDVQPVLALARTAQAKGHDVTVVGPPDFETWAHELGLHYVSAGDPMQPQLNEWADRLTRPMSFVRLLREHGQRFYDTVAPALLEAARGADLLVGASLVLMGPAIAEHLGIPYRQVMFCPQMVPSWEHPPPVFSTVTRVRFLNDLLWSGGRALVNFVSRSIVNDHRASLGLEPIRDVTFAIARHGTIVASDPELGRCEDSHYTGVRQTGYWHLDVPGEPIPDRVRDFIDAGAPPVYVGFGSMVDADARTTTQLILEATHEAGVRVLISHGWAELASGSLPSHACAIGSVDHATLFPQMAGIVHHGGAGTTHAATRAGVPQIVVPHLVDQFYWARQVCDAGLGPRTVTRARLSQHRFAKLLRSLPEFALQAKQMGEIVRLHHGTRRALRLLEAAAPSPAPHFQPARAVPFF